MNKLKLFEAFAGYGGASFALQKAGVDFEIAGYSEIDKFAIQCYEQNHSQNHAPKNYGDITKIDPHQLPDFDLFTGGFPCQAFSIAGKGLGELDVRGTLFHDIIRIAEVKRPRYLLLENVKGLTSKKHRATFGKILSELYRIGYDVEWKVLNSKDYGIPQNRERVFFVCKLGRWTVGEFEFPEPEELTLCLRDLLEDEVDEKYYLKSERVQQLLSNVDGKGIWNTNPSGKSIEGEPMFNTQDRHGILQINKGARSGDRIYSTEGIAATLKAQVGGTTQDRAIIQGNNPRHSNNWVYNPDGRSPTLRDVSADGSRQPFIKINNATKKGFCEGFVGDGVSLEQPKSKTRRGRVQKQVSATLQCNATKGVITDTFQIRKLTPIECFRLMGFSNDEINLTGLSNTQRYKLAGNGWDINLVGKIFAAMFDGSSAFESVSDRQHKAFHARKINAFADA